MLLQTKSAYLRNLTPSDLDVIFAYRNDICCARYQRWEDTSRESLGNFIKQFSESDFLSEQEEQHYAICTNDHSMAGDLSCFYNEEDACITLGITIVPKYQRRGLATEILEAMVTAAQKRYPKLDLVALIHPDNRASIALFERLKFARECYAQSINSYVYVRYGNPDPEKPSEQK